jgi:hypothetical protein
LLPPSSGRYSPEDCNLHTRRRKNLKSPFRNNPSFIETQQSLPCSQELATDPSEPNTNHNNGELNTVVQTSLKEFAGNFNNFLLHPSQETRSGYAARLVDGTG